MANLTTTNDILLDALWKASLTNSATSADTGTAYYAKGLNYLNRVYLDLKKGNGPLSPAADVTFRWAIKNPSSTIIIQPKYDTGSISVTNNSDTATLSANTTTRVGWYLDVQNESDVFRIITHTGGTATLTLDSVYTGDTNATANYKLIKTQYTIGTNDIMRIVEPMRVHQLGSEGEGYLITSMESSQFAKEWSLGRLGAGVPTKFRIVKENDGNVIVQFNKYRQDDLLRVEFDYIDIPTPLTASPDLTPEVPREYRSIMSDWTAALLLQDKQDSRAPTLFQLAQAGYEAMVRNEEYKSHRSSTRLGKISPRLDNTGRRSLRNIIDVTYNT